MLLEQITRADQIDHGPLYLTFAGHFQGECRVARGNQLHTRIVLRQVGADVIVDHQRNALTVQFVQCLRAAREQACHQHKGRRNIRLGKTQNMFAAGAGGKRRHQVGSPQLYILDQARYGLAAHPVKLNPGAQADLGQQISRQTTKNPLVVKKGKRQEVFRNGHLQTRMSLDPALFRRGELQRPTPLDAHCANAPAMQDGVVVGGRNGRQRRIDQA